MKRDELDKIQNYMRRVFQSEGLEVRSRPRKDDSAEVYVGEEFLGILFRDDEDEDDLSYNFSMAILEYDLEEE